ncbi:MAG: TraB/GumN family protein, partial [Pontixanthobacter sp.]
MSASIRFARGLACSVLAPIALAACQPAASPTENMGDPSPALWIVENDAGEVEGWLFGTIHSLPDGVRWRTPMLDRAIASSDALVLEISELGQDDELGAIFAELARSGGLPPLLDRVKPPLRDDLSRLMQAGGYTPDHFATTESWAAALTLAQVGSPASSQNGVDRALVEEIDDILVLEGARAQLSIFDRLPARDQRDLLEAIAADADDDRAAEYRELVRIWRSGDMGALAMRAREGILADPELRDALLVDRNLRWGDAIDRWMRAQGPLMVAVGASHMAGSDGLPILLARRGYTVRRIQ